MRVPDKKYVDNLSTFKLINGLLELEARPNSFHWMIYNDWLNGLGRSKHFICATLFRFRFKMFIVQDHPDKSHYRMNIKNL